MTVGQNESEPPVAQSNTILVDLSDASKQYWNTSVRHVTLPLGHVPGPPNRGGSEPLAEKGALAPSAQSNGSLACPTGILESYHLGPGPPPRPLADNLKNGEKQPGSARKVLGEATDKANSPCSGEPQPLAPTGGMPLVCATNDSPVMTSTVLDSPSSVGSINSGSFKSTSSASSPSHRLKRRLEGASVGESAVRGGSVFASMAAAMADRAALRHRP